MALPKRIAASDLEAEGFEIVSEGVAVHSKFKVSKRFLCTTCGYWDISLQNRANRPGMLFCGNCWASTHKADNLARQ